MKILRNIIKPLKKTVYNSQIIFVRNYRIFSKPTLFLVILFCIALLPLLQANVNFLDDSFRTLHGNRDWAYLHSRWVSEYLSIFIHADISLRDISPFPQLIAVLIMSLAGVFLCWIVLDGKLTKIGILVSALLGLSPFFLESFAFKFDSPYMALSVLTSIFPFLFAFKKQKLFAVTSFLGLLVMLTTYQFSSGIYIMIVIFLLFQSWNAKTKSYREMGKFLLVSATSYIVALIFFRIFLLQNKIFKYNTVFSMDEMVLGIFDNFKNNLEDVIQFFNVFWIWLLLITIIAFMIKSVIISKQNKIVAFLAVLVILFLSLFFFQGLFIFIDGVNSVPRYFIGFNALIVLVALCLSKPPYKFFATPAIVLLYCFFVFAFAFGNALTDQKRFKTFVATMLVNDLSKIITKEDQLKETSIYLREPIGNAPSVKFLQKKYPITKKLIPNDFGKHVFGYTNLAWYNFPAHRPEKISKQVKAQAKILPVLVDSYYYTIRGNSKSIHIWFNNR